MQLFYVDYYEEELGKMWPVKKAVATECHCLKHNNIMHSSLPALKQVGAKIRT
jgi:hypothetical protein